VVRASRRIITLHPVACIDMVVSLSLGFNNAHQMLPPSRGAYIFIGGNSASLGQGGTLLGSYLESNLTLPPSSTCTTSLLE
jgi:hypothetical protein